MRVDDYTLDGDRFALDPCSACFDEAGGRRYTYTGVGLAGIMVLLVEMENGSRTPATRLQQRQPLAMTNLPLSTLWQGAVGFVIPYLRSITTIERSQ